jgi:hexosaminidase
LVLEDAPAFAWRGMHLDCSRHFWCVDDVLRFIDLAALHKFNVFHWHLTDDQGWRLPIEGYPLLTERAAWREGTMIGHDCDRATNSLDGIRHGGFYSHSDIRRVVAHAAARGVHVLPEIDVPGHVQALLTAYPEFGNTGVPPGVRTCWGISPHTLNLEPHTFDFLERVVETVADLFPFPFVHLGGDEAKTGEWMESTRIPERMAELGILDVSCIQPFFTQRLVEMLARRDRRMIGWDEIIEHRAPDSSAAVMYWRDSEKTDLSLDLKALERGNGLVLANWSKTYFDLYQEAGPGRDFEPLAICGRLTIEDVYRWNPLARYPEALATGVWGAQAQVWTEYIPHRPHLDYMVYPRACALSQVLWRGEGREDFSEFMKRLDRHLPLLDRLGVAYRPAFPTPPDNTSNL